MSLWETKENWKGVFIDRLMKDRKFDSYLELGIGAGLTWNEVSCKKKVGVDISVILPGVINCSTDHFFSENTEKFDVIYIDAWHEKNQVLKDYQSAYHSLSDDGIILMHDVNPNKEQDTHLNACGDAYELWMELVNHHDKLFVIGEDVGGPCPGRDTLGIILKKYHTPKDLVIPSRGYHHFASNRSRYISEIQLSYDQLKAIQ